MGTSGVFRSWINVDVECFLCGWSGWVEACEDREDMSLTWVCKGCGVEHEELEREDD